MTEGVSAAAMMSTRAVGAMRMAESPVEPANFVATIYHLLGIDPATELHDQLNRPFTLAKAKPIPLQFAS